MTAHREGNRDGQLADRRLCPAVGLPHGRAGRPGPARWTGYAARASTRSQYSPASLTPMAAASRSGQQGGCRPAARTSTRRWSWRPRSGQGRHCGADRRHGRGPQRPRPPPGRRVAGVLLRQLTCTAGEIDVDVSYVPRPEYGLIYPMLEAVAGGIAAHGGASGLLLSAPAGFQVAGDTATAQLHLVAGQTVSFALQHGQLQDPPLAVWEASQIADRLQDTTEGWRSWSAFCTRPMRGPGARSLCFIPAGSCRRSRWPRPGPSWPRPRPRCRRRSAASATGITAIRGCATPA